MDKLLLFPGKSDRGIFTYVIDAERGFLEKTAAEYHPTIAAYINSAKPIPGKTQILLTALGAGEFWGCNVNGDWFGEQALAHEGSDYGYKTFEIYAKAYKHHINKDPTTAYGDVPLAVYNPVFHRVELIVVLDNSRAPDIAQRIENGEYPDWSMGCKVPFDVCSICGNKAPSRKYYCEHLKYYMGKIHPGTGKQAFAINPQPKFFDISQVLIGADRIAKTLRKVAHASHLPIISSAYLAEKRAEAAKRAAIEKEIPANEPPASQDNVKNLDTLVRSIPEVKATEAPLPRQVLDRLGEHPLPRVLSTMTMLGILPKPQEFQRIFLISINRRPLADELDARNLCFDPMSVESPSGGCCKMAGVDYRNFDETIMHQLTPFMAERSYVSTHLGPRLANMEKRAEVCVPPTFIKVGQEPKEPQERKPLGPAAVLLAAAGVYAALARKAPAEGLSGIDKILRSNVGIGLAAALGVGLIRAFHNTAAPNVKGDYTPGKYENPDANDVFARIEQLKQKPYTKLGSVSALGSAGKRLFLGIPAAYMASGVLQKHKELNPYDEEGRIKSFVRRNPDVISGALLADAVLSAHGHPVSSANLIRKAKGAFSAFAKAAAACDELMGTDFAKTADAQEFLTNALTWPLAMGRANLPGRIVGGLFDQAAIEASSKLLERRRKAKEAAGQHSGQG